MLKRRCIVSRPAVDVDVARGVERFQRRQNVEADGRERFRVQAFAGRGEPRDLVAEGRAEALEHEVAETVALAVRDLPPEAPRRPVEHVRVEQVLGEERVRRALRVAVGLLALGGGRRHRRDLDHERRRRRRGGGGGAGPGPRGHGDALHLVDLRAGAGAQQLADAPLLLERAAREGGCHRPSHEVFLPPPTGGAGVTCARAQSSPMRAREEERATCVCVS